MQQRPFLSKDRVHIRDRHASISLIAWAGPSDSAPHIRRIPFGIGAPITSKSGVLVSFICAVPAGRTITSPVASSSRSLHHRPQGRSRFRTARPGLRAYCCDNDGNRIRRLTSCRSVMTVKGCLQPARVIREYPIVHNDGQIGIVGDLHHHSRK